MNLRHVTTISLLLLSPALFGQSVTVTAKAVSGSPGAIVCADMATVSAALDRYNQNRASATHPGPQGESTLTNGDALEQPKGCAVAKEGTRMTLKSVKNGAASVTFKTPDGKEFSGVTQPRMYTKESSSSR